MDQIASGAAVQGSNVGITLRQRPAAVILGQAMCRTLFIHAGLPVQLLLRVTHSLTSSEPDEILDKLNAIMAGSARPQFWNPILLWYQLLYSV